VSVVTVRVFASHPVATEQYTRVLAGQDDFRVVSDEGEFRVGVFDGESSAVEAVLTLARLKYPGMRPLLVSFPCDENECIRWLFRGVWGLVTYDRYEVDLLRAARHLDEGQLWYPAPVVVRWMRIDAARRTAALRFSLTKREGQIMEFLLRRFSNREIAEILSISDRTVKYHVSNILTKLRVGSREELVAKRVPDFGLG
jgi:DNA-binding NarL/FixJ family response regulator